MISDDDARTIEMLKFELEFLEKGGYGRLVRTPWIATRPFQDSPTCLNFSNPARPHPCSECLLMQFVPPGRRSESVPCHHIPLNAENQTIHVLQAWEDQETMEEVIKDWLRATIRALEMRQVPSAK